MITWTRLHEHPDGFKRNLANMSWQGLPSADSPLKYHNIDHVRSMYEYLADENEPYSEALDWAVLYHDMVYDDLPDKELRSADLFETVASEFRFDEELIANVQAMIMATRNHDAEHPLVSAIIRADLHALTNPLTTYHNYGKILQESIHLYDIDHVTFAENNLKFMQKLSHTVNENILYDREHEQFYSRVLNGINLTMNISEAFLK